MKTFHHGGRIGDLVFALWTMCALGGGKLIVTDFQKGNWSLGIARTMLKFLKAQPYIADVEVLPYSVRGPIDFDLHEAENDYNPESFPEWNPNGPWPGNANIAMRYALHFDKTFDGTPWVVPQEAMIEHDVVFHCPIRRSVRTWQDWFAIVTGLQDKGLRVAVLGNEPPLHNQSLPDDWDVWDSAVTIVRSKCFLGTVSSMNAIAEGMGKKRFVEHAPDCFNVTTDVVLNGLSTSEIVAAVTEYCKGVQS